MSDSLQNKILNCEPYDLERDVRNYLFLTKLKSLDIEIFQEIFFNSLRIPLISFISSFALDLNMPLNLNMEENELLRALKKFEKIKLLEIKSGEIVIDKELRKYFEHELVRFNQDQIPGVPFIQNLLRKAPSQNIPYWYSLPRTSENTFQSIIDKFLATPQIFNRHFQESKFDDITSCILELVYKAPGYQIPAETVIKKLQISDEQFAKSMLFLEFSFLVCLFYKKISDGFEAILSPFAEIHAFLLYKESVIPKPIKDLKKVKQEDVQPFAFVEELTLLLDLLKQLKIRIVAGENGFCLDTKSAELVKKSHPKWKTSEISYFKKLIKKLISYYFVSETDGQLLITAEGINWLKLSTENRAYHLFRHPELAIARDDFPANLVTERRTREIIDSVKILYNLDFVLYADFEKSVMVPLLDQTTLTLVSQGATKKYKLPAYTEEEKRYIHTVIMDSLFESGIITKGTYEGQECLALTRPFGMSFFS